MDNLPNEILDFIFADLHLLQKQECMLVCRRWSNVIRSTSLFFIVHINETRTINKIMDMLDKNPSCRNQVQTLVNHGSTPITMSDRQLLKYFPLLRHIHMKNTFLELQNTITKDDTLFSKFSNWRNQLEIIEQSMQTQANNSLLLSGLFSGLQVLILDSYYSYPPCSAIVVNTPNLKRLTLIEACISTNDLEVLHSGLKALESLTLERALLTIVETAVDPPATSSLKALSIDFHDISCGIAVRWLQYILKKYSRLLHLRFVFYWTTDIPHSYENEIINCGILPLIQNLGDRLESLEISTSDQVENVIEMLNTFNFDFEMLRLNSLISNSRTSFENLYELGKYVHHLSISLNNFKESKIKSFKQLSMLKTLQFGFMEDSPHHAQSLKLNEVLDLFPNSLESLEIYDFIVSCRDHLSSTYHLKKLTIHSESIYQVVYKFVSSCLPSLRYLKLDMRKPGCNRILLKGVGLKYLNISIKDRQCISIRTLNDNTTRYYPLREYTYSVFNYSEEKDKQHLDIVKRTTSQNGNLAFEFICDSVKDLIINNHLAL